MLLGSSGLGSEALSALAGGGRNVTSTEDLAALPSLEPGRSLLFIDGVWAPSADSDKLEVAIGPLVLAGLPVFIINGTAEGLRDLIPDASVSWMSSSQDTVAVRGMKYGQMLSVCVDIGGSSSDRDKLLRAIACAANWGSNNLLPITYDDSEEEGAHWREVLQYNFYSADLLQPYGRTVLRNTYYQWVNDSELTSAGKSMYMAHYWTMTDPGHAVYSDDWRNSGITTWARVSGDRGVADLLRYGPITTGRTDSVEVNLGPPYSSKGLADPSRWSYQNPGMEVISHSDSSIGLFATIHNFDPASDAGATTLWAEPGAIYRTDVSSACLLNETHQTEWARPTLLGWERHQGSIMVEGRLS